MAHLHKRLADSSLKVTPQRLSILNEIHKAGHISIEDLYTEVKKTFPSISLATVYKNITSLKDEEIVTQIALENNKPKFEIKKSPHGHFICTSCNKVLDFVLPKEMYQPKEFASVEKSQVYLYGTCNQCKKES